METIIIYVVLFLVGIAIGVAITYYFLRNALLKKSHAILEEAKEKAEVMKKEKILQAKEKFLQLKSEHQKLIDEKNRNIQKSENRIRQKETNLNQKIQETQRKNNELSALKANLNAQLELINKKQAELDKMHADQVQQLENISKLSAKEAKNQLIESLKSEAKAEAMMIIREITEEARLTAERNAKKIVVETIQRTASEHAIENTVTVFNIDNENIKGRIIGREGRNIRALESLTGIEIIIDDTPDAILLSGFDPIRREIARLSLQKLVADGRIHPARIEEVVTKTRKEVDQEILETGKRTVARLSATMAAELGLNPKKAKRAGLLHDIGKIAENEAELPHALLGKKLAEKYKEHPDVCNAIGAHHDEIEMETLIAPIVQVCDAISGSRPGARREVVEAYIQRLKNLEQIALSYPGVVKTYAIQAGRELRVIVGADKVSDAEADSLSYDLSKKIQEEMTYPGQIKITVIRETRAINYAK